METQLSLHANTRSQQRGIKKEIMDIVLTEGDLYKNCGQGCVSIQISQKKLRRLVKCKVLAAKTAERLQRVVLIDSGPQIITVFKAKTKRRTFH